MRHAFLAFFSAVIVFGFATGARADGLGRIVISASGGGPVCMPATPCSHPTDCTALGETCQSVTLAAGFTGQFCLRDVTSEVFCCVEGSGMFDCPVGSSCSMIGSGGGSVPGICTGSARSYCVDSTAIPDGALSAILSCIVLPAPPCVVPRPLRPPNPVPFAMGDCDGDGIANELDANPCIVDVPTCSDGGVPDASTTPDAGTIARDAGGNADAGPPDQDAGDVPVDAGSLAMDAATIPPGITFRGAGGCACNVAGNDSRRAHLALALVLVVLARRRRAK